MLGVSTTNVTSSDGRAGKSEVRTRGSGVCVAPYAPVTGHIAVGFPGPTDHSRPDYWTCSTRTDGTAPRTPTEGEKVTWTFEQPPGHEFTVTLDCRIGPSVQWGRTGHTVVEAEGRRVELSHHTRVMP